MARRQDNPNGSSEIATPTIPGTPTPTIASTSFKLDDELAILPDELVCIGLSLTPQHQELWRTKLIQAIFFPERVAGVTASLEMDDEDEEVDAEGMDPEEETPTFVSLTQTLEGASLTADIKLLRALFTEENADEMIYAVGDGGLRGFWRGEEALDEPWRRLRRVRYFV
jgi:hypothetical protein